MSMDHVEENYVKSLQARVKEPEEQLRLSNIDACNEAAENARLREQVEHAKDVEITMKEFMLENHKLKRVVDAAREFHEFLGDGDNGPRSYFSEQWYALDAKFREMDGSLYTSSEIDR